MRQMTLVGFIFLLFIGWVQALPGDIQTWTNVSEIHQIASKQDEIWAATNGGIFKYYKNKSTKWTSSEGLGTTEMSGIVVTDSSEVIAVGRNGLISRFENSTSEFKVIHSDFSHTQKDVLNSGMATGGNYLFITFDDQISIFDINKNRSIYSIHKLSSTSLKNENIVKLELIRGVQDSLIVQTQTQAFVTTINLENIDQSFNQAGDWLNIADPSIWVSMKLDARKTSSISHKDSTTWFVGDVQAPNPNYDVEFNQLIQFDEVIYAIGPSSILARYKNQRWTIHEFKGLPFYVPSEITSDQYGQVYVSALDNDTMLGVGVNYFRRGHQGDWSIIGRNSFYGEAPKTFVKSLKTLSISQEGTLSSSGWGGGISVLQSANNPLVTPQYQIYNGSTDACLAYDNTFFSVVPTMTLKDENNEIIFHTFQKNTAQIGFINTDGRLSCALIASESAELTQLSQQRDDTFLIMGPNNLYQFEVQGDFDNRSINILKTIGAKHVPGGIKTVQDLNDRLWVLGAGGLYTLCDLNNNSGLCPEGYPDTLVNVTIQLNLPQKSYRDMEVDVFGNLWVASDEGLHKILTSQTQVTNTGVSKISSQDGLASDEIFDFHLDALTGDIWVAHLRAISRIESSVRLINEDVNSGLTPYAYPTPFKLKKHSVMHINNVAYQSEVLVLNSARVIVKKFGSIDSQGGEILWDGRTHSGRQVSSGVYYISIKEQGGRNHLIKVIIIR